MSGKISIAMATYNGARYLAEQLESFAQQSLKPDELVVSDDRSTDETVAILKGFAARVPFTVRIIENEVNAGYARNFSRALEATSGDYVFLSDQDDVWLPQKIEEVIAFLRENETIQLVIHDVEMATEQLVRLGQTKAERIEGLGVNVSQWYISGMATAVRGAFLRLCVPIPSTIAHDTWLHKCAESVGRKAYLKRVLGLYRRHGNAVMGVDGLGGLSIARRQTLRERWALRKLIGAEPRIDLSPCDRAQWLMVRREALLCLGMGNEAAIESAYNKAISACHLARRRVDIVALPTRLRITPVLQLYSSGAYGGGRGWKLALKDLLCRQSQALGRAEGPGPV